MPDISAAEVDDALLRPPNVNAETPAVTESWFDHPASVEQMPAAGDNSSVSQECIKRSTHQFLPSDQNIDNPANPYHGRVLGHALTVCDSPLLVQALPFPADDAPSASGEPIVPCQTLG
jgi:hypothetical protein